jgi:type VI protein secretion system component VasA
MAVAPNNQTTPHRSTPTPDPTELTTQQLALAVESLKELFTQRLDAIDTAVKVAHDNLVRVPTETDKAIQHLREVFEERNETIREKFSGVQVQFKERDVRVEQTARASKEALDAALQAAKEAVGKQNDSFVTSIAKSEGATSKQIEQLGVQINTMTGANSAKVDDLKERIQRLEGEDRGSKAVQIDRTRSTQNSIAIVGLIVFGGLSFLGLVVSLAVHWGGGLR